ncbi:hypothetical protein ACFVZR_07435 [Streptomyces sp. NPDC058316]|uniref:hypothetical protein n=1 Tax=Streptomyces sp. NPDC058316 TaxID=3346442 RepID=UPI0036E441AC
MSIIPSAAPNNTNPTALSPEREAEIRDVEQAAVFGPWLNDGAEIYQAPHGYIEIDRRVGETLDIENDEQSNANAAFIAAARTAVPELLAEIDRLRAELAAKRAEVLREAADAADARSASHSVSAVADVFRRWADMATGVLDLDQVLGSMSAAAWSVEVRPEALRKADEATTGGAS